MVLEFVYRLGLFKGCCVHAWRLCARKHLSLFNSLRGNVVFISLAKFSLGAGKVRWLLRGAKEAAH